MISILIKFTVLLMLIAIINGSGINNSESPGFFLKVTKNVPRLGRRSSGISDFENFFVKTSKGVPRIGRSDNSVRNKYKIIYRKILH